MEITLSKRDARHIVGFMVVEAIIAFAAIRKAIKAERKADEKALEAAIYDFSSLVKEERIKELEKENAKLKSK